MLRWPNRWTFHIFIELPSLIPARFKGDAFNGLQKEETAVIGDQLFTDILVKPGRVIYYFSGPWIEEIFGTKISYDGKAGNA